MCSVLLWGVSLAVWPPGCGVRGCATPVLGWFLFLGLRLHGWLAVFEPVFSLVWLSIHPAPFGAGFWGGSYAYGSFGLWSAVVPCFLSTFGLWHWVGVLVSQSPFILLDSLILLWPVFRAGWTRAHGVSIL